MTPPLRVALRRARELGLVVAVLIGFGFGFVLERAGFGRANKLAGQFYGTDMTVLKVMFSAIVTAMLGTGHPLGPRARRPARAGRLATSRPSSGR